MGKTEKQLDRLINTYTLDYFFSNKSIIDVCPKPDVLCFSENYTYYNGVKLLARIVNNVIVGVMIGEKAKFEYHKLLGENELNMEKVFVLIENMFHVSKRDINSKKRKQEIVWCRYLSTWFYYNYIESNYNNASRELGWCKNGDHVSIIHAVKQINTEDKYLKPFQRNWKNKFLNKIKEFEYVHK